MRWLNDRGRKREKLRISGIKAGNEVRVFHNDLSVN
jgi:hypothetical protein